MLAQATVSLTHSATASAGTSPSVSSMSAWASSSCPVAARASARAISRAPRSSIGALSGSSRSAAPNQRAALARIEPPAPGGGFIDRPAHQWMPEAEAARHIRRADEVPGEQLVERLHARLLVRSRCGGGQLRLERVARNRGAIQQRAGRLREQAELLRQRGGHRARHLDAPEAECGRVRGRGAGYVGGAGELLEEERVAAALLVEAVRQRGVHVLTQQATRVIALEATELEPGERARTICALEGGAQALG